MLLGVYARGGNFQMRCIILLRGRGRSGQIGTPCRQRSLTRRVVGQVPVGNGVIPSQTAPERPYPPHKHQRGEYARHLQRMRAALVRRASIFNVVDKIAHINERAPRPPTPSLLNLSF